MAECPSIYTNGQEVGKTCQRKNTRAISQIFLVSFSPFRHADETPGAFKRNLGGSDPVSTFGRQNRTNTGVAPAQIEVFVRVNETPVFRGEHCVRSCVHRSLRIRTRRVSFDQNTACVSVFCHAEPQGSASFGRPTNHGRPQEGKNHRWLRVFPAESAQHSFLDQGPFRGKFWG